MHYWDLILAGADGLHSTIAARGGEFSTAPKRRPLPGTPGCHRNSAAEPKQREFAATPDSQRVWSFTPPRAFVTRKFPANKFTNLTDLINLLGFKGLGRVLDRDFRQLVE